MPRHISTTQTLILDEDELKQAAKDYVLKEYGLEFDNVQISVYRAYLTKRVDTPE